MAQGKGAAAFLLLLCCSASADLLVHVHRGTWARTLLVLGPPLSVARDRVAANADDAPHPIVEPPTSRSARGLAAPDASVQCLAVSGYPPPSRHFDTELLVHSSL